MNVSWSKQLFIPFSNFELIFIKTVFFKLLCRIAENLSNRFGSNFVLLIFMHDARYWRRDFLKKNVFPVFYGSLSSKKEGKTKFFFAKFAILSIFQNLLNPYVSTPFGSPILRRSRSRFDNLFTNLITPLKQLM